MQRAEDGSFCTGQEESAEGPRAAPLCRGKLRESAWPWPQADEQERLDGQAGEGNPMFTQAHWPNSPCGRASAAGRARPPSRSAVECVFIYILPGEAAWGLMVGTAAAQRALGAAVVPSWLGMGLHTSLPGDSRSRWALGRWNRS